MPEDRRPLPRSFWVIPGLALAAGLLLGGLLVGVSDIGRNGDPDGSASQSPSPSPTGSLPADREIVVPGACLAAVNEAERTLGLVRRGATALRDLDAAELERVIDRLQQVEPRLRELAGQCRDAAVTAQTPASEM